MQDRGRSRMERSLGAGDGFAGQGFSWGWTLYMAWIHLSRADAAATHPPDSTVLSAGV